jgi:conjugation system TraG family ATPase
MERELSELLPIYGFEKGCILSKQGDFTLAFRFEKPEIFTLSEEQYEALHLAFVKAIRVLPPQSILHLMDWFLTDRYTGGFQQERSFLGQSSERFYHERPWLRHEAYLFLTRKPRSRQDSTSALSGLLRGSLLPRESIDDAMVADFRETASQFVRILEDSGLIKVTALDESDLGSTAGKAGLIERYCTLGREEQPILRDIEWKDGMRIGDQHAVLFTLADVEDLPGVCSSRSDYPVYATHGIPYPVGFAAGLGVLLSCDHICNQYIFIDDAQEAVKKLESKRLRLQSLAGYSRENAVGEQGVNAFLNEAVSEQRQPVLAHFNVFAWTGERGELRDICNRIGSAMTQLDASVRQETVGAPQIWWAGIPGNEGDFPMNETFRTFAEQAACFFNLETNYRSSKSPFGLRLGDRLTGRPVHVDIDEEPRRLGLTGNSNMFILSGSGGGKSFFMNHLVRSYYEQGVHIVLIDIGHSYEIQCALHGGAYFTYREEAPIRFNPFYIGPGDTLDTEKRESIKSLLLALWKKTEESHNRAEYVALSNAVQGYFDLLERKPAVFPCFDTFYEFLRDEFTATLKTDNVKEKDFDLNNLLYVLRPFFKGGEFDYLLNAKEGLDLLHQRFIVYELDNIKSHPVLFGVVSLSIMELFVSKMRKLKGVRKMIVIEEAWRAIATQGMAEYIKFLFKTVRKFLGIAAVVTQEIEDIATSTIIRHAIINNSDVKILLDQSKFANKFDDIQGLLGTTDKQKAEILSINKGHQPGSAYKDVWIGLGATHSKVYRLEVSPEEYYTYTSDQRDKVLVNRYIQRYGDVQTAIKRLVIDLQINKEGRP